MKYRKTDKPRWFVILIIVVSLILSLNLGISSWNLKQRQGIVEKAENDLKKLTIDRAKLERELKYVRSNEFIEKEARDKLGLSKEGETVIVIGQEQSSISAIMEKKHDNIINKDGESEWWRLLKSLF